MEEQGTGTILEYARTQTRDFTEFPFQTADALVFALLSYDRIPQSVPHLKSLVARYGSLSRRVRSFDWRHPVASAQAIVRVPFDGPTMRQVEQELTLYEEHHPYLEEHAGFVPAGTPRQFYRSIAHNPRFAVTRVNAADERFDLDQQTQFAAMTFLLPTGTLVVAFRGTDDSLIGWKEDFNMAFTYPVPAQKQAADYLERVGALWNGEIVLTGHSKGGNLAIYAAMNAPDAIKDRITRIYTLDGPGFSPEVIHSYEYSTVVHRITRVIPDGSIIGMLLAHSPHAHRIVVKSSADGLMQHSCYTWLMHGDHFVQVPDVTPTSQTFAEAMNSWLGGMTQRQREHGVEALFRVLTSSGHGTITELMTAGPRIIPDMLGSYVGLSSEERKYINQALWMFAGATFHH